MSRTATFVVLAILAGALAVAVLVRSRRQPAVAPAMVPATVVVHPEMPIWAFGLRSTITDSLPRELDSLGQWGDYDDGVRPVARAFDANGDGRTDFLVRSHTRMCGLGGCPTALLTRRSDGNFADVLGGLHHMVYVTSGHKNGWPVLWVDDGGRNGGIFRLIYMSGGYVIADTLRAAFDTAESTARQQQHEDSLFRAMRTAPIR